MKFGNKVLGLLVIFICSLLVLAADKGNSEEGKKLFEDRCKTCHGASGDGNMIIAKALGVQIRPFSSKEVQSQEDAVLKKIITEGRGKMVPFGLTDTEVDDVIAFIRSLKK